MQTDATKFLFISKMFLTEGNFSIFIFPFAVVIELDKIKSELTNFKALRSKKP